MISIVFLALIVLAGAVIWRQVRAATKIFTGGGKEFSGSRDFEPNPGGFNTGEAIEMVKENGVWKLAARKKDSAA